MLNELNYTYKNYIIKPEIVCFDLRYFVYGEGFAYNHYADIDKAKEAIDNYICNNYIKSLITNISNKLDVNEDIVLESFKNIILYD